MVVLLLVSAAWHLVSVSAREASRHSRRRLGSRRQDALSGGSAQTHGEPNYEVGVSDTRGLLISRRRSLEDANYYADDQVEEEEEVDDAAKDAEDDAVGDGEYADDANNNYDGQDNWWEEEIAANTDDDGAESRWTQVSRSFHNAEDSAWQYYEAPPAEWTAAQWDLVCGLVGGLLVFCCGLSACCAYCCITQADTMDYVDPMSPMSVGGDKSTDGQSSRRFWSEKKRRLRGRDDDYTAYYKDEKSYIPPTPKDGMLAKLDYATVRRKDEEAQEKAQKELEDEKKKEDKLLQARDKHNFVGYYVS